MKLKMGWVVLACLCLLPLGVAAKAKTQTKAKAPAETHRLVGLLQVVPVEKTLNSVSKVTGVFKKASRTANLKCSLQNQGSSEIRAVRGVLRFTSYFGDPIVDLSVEVVSVMAPGQKVTVSWQIKRERFGSDAAFKTFIDTPLDKMRAVWIPSIVVLADGTTLKN
jgi:hypothetical protein